MSEASHRMTTAFLELRDKLKDVHVNLESFRQALVDHPDDTALVLTVRSLENRHRDLVQALLAEGDALIAQLEREHSD